MNLCSRQRQTRIDATVKDSVLFEELLQLPKGITANIWQSETALHMLCGVVKFISGFASNPLGSHSKHDNDLHLCINVCYVCKNDNVY